MDQALIPMIQEDLKSKKKGVHSIEGKESVANSCWVRMDLNFTLFKLSVGIQKKVRK
jgi:hypothetical protein